MAKKLAPPPKILTEEDFDAKYHQSNIKSENFDDNGRLETFGKDLAKVLKFANNKKTKKRVWTAVDLDDGMYYVAGYHLVNRVYYLITKEEWKKDTEEYLIDSFDEEEDEPCNAEEFIEDGYSPSEEEE